MCPSLVSVLKPFTQLFVHGGRQKKADRCGRTGRAHTPATRSSTATATATATPIVFTSTTANAAATSTPSGVTSRPLSWPCSCSSSCSHHNSTLTANRHPPVHYLTIDRSMGIDEVNADCTLHDVSIPPSMNPLPANSSNSRPSPTVPRPPVRLHICFIIYERAVHTLMALFSAPRRWMFRLIGLAQGE